MGLHTTFMGVFTGVPSAGSTKYLTAICPSPLRIRDPFLRNGDAYAAREQVSQDHRAMPGIRTARLYAGRYGYPFPRIASPFLSMRVGKNCRPSSSQPPVRISPIADEEKRRPHAPSFRGHSANPWPVLELTSRRSFFKSPLALASLQHLYHRRSRPGPVLLRDDRTVWQPWCGLRGQSWARPGVVI